MPSLGQRKEGAWTEATCEHCWKKYQVRTLYHSRQNHHYCTPECWRNAQMQGLAKEDLVRECITCGATFTVRPGSVGKPRYHCSKKCQKRRITHTCQACGKTFEKTATFVNSKFCSIACRERARPMTDMEQSVWEALALSGMTITREKPIGRYSADFVIEELKIAIEADGNYWHDVIEVKEGRRLDGRRKKEAAILAAGYTLVRVTKQGIHRRFRKEKPRIILDLILEESGNMTGSQPSSAFPQVDQSTTCSCPETTPPTSPTA